MAGRARGAHARGCGVRRRRAPTRARPDGGTDAPAVEVVGEIGETEGALNLIAWNGYTEDGTDYSSTTTG